LESGISLLIMVGILARFPQAFIQGISTRVTNNNSEDPENIGYQRIIIWLLIVLPVFY
jgi:preprotein translocase subunit SecY